MDNVIEQVISKVNLSATSEQVIRDKWDKQKQQHKQWVEAKKLVDIVDVGS